MNNVSKKNSVAPAEFFDKKDGKRGKFKDLKGSRTVQKARNKAYTFFAFRNKPQKGFSLTREKVEVRFMPFETLTSSEPGGVKGAMPPPPAPVKNKQ